MPFKYTRTRAERSKVNCFLYYASCSKYRNDKPHGIGQVERYSRTLMDVVRCFIWKRQHQWDLYLPQIAMALRSSVNRSTGFTPNKLMLGREVNTPADLMFPANQLDPQSTEEYVNDLAAQIKKAPEVARKTLKTSQMTMKKIMI